MSTSRVHVPVVWTMAAWLCTAVLVACRVDDDSQPPVVGPTPVPTTIFVVEHDPDAMRAAVPALAMRESAFAAALGMAPPVVTLPPAALDNPHTGPVDGAGRSPVRGAGLVCARSPALAQRGRRGSSVGATRTGAGGRGVSRRVLLSCHHVQRRREQHDGRGRRR